MMTINNNDDGSNDYNSNEKNTDNLDDAGGHLNTAINIYVCKMS